MKGKTEIKEGLSGMLYCINEIEKILKELKDTPYFKGLEYYKEFKHHNIYDDVLRYLSYMCAEADDNIPEEFMIKNSELPWKEMKALLEFASYDVDVAWHIVTEELPNNKIIIENLLKKLS